MANSSTRYCVPMSIPTIKTLTIKNDLGSFVKLADDAAAMVSQRQRLTARI
jgi:hypothetical protein